MLFGLTNAPSTFQSFMNNIFKEYLRKFVLVFFNILIYSLDYYDHLRHLGATSNLFQDNQLVINLKNYTFA